MDKAKQSKTTVVIYPYLNLFYFVPSVPTNGRCVHLPVRIQSPFNIYHMLQ